MKRALGRLLVAQPLFAKRCLATLAATAILTGQASAQMAGGVVVDRDAADSAATARTQYRAAREALMRFDTVTAIKQLSGAAHAWPLQPVYPDALLALALRAHDTERVAQALDLANRISVALPASASPLMESLPATQSLRDLRNTQNILRAGIAGSKVYRTLADSTLFPEGLSVDPRNGTMYVSSVSHRNVLAVAPDGRSYMLLRGEYANVGGIFGIVVDTLRGVLWAASAPTPEMTAKGDSGTRVAALLAIRLSDGQLVRRIAIPSGVTNSSPGDIALSARGDVLLSDSQAAVLWWLRGSADTLVTIHHRLFRSLQGVVPSANGKTALVADYSHGLLRVELKTGVVQRVADLPGHTSVGIDGMVRYGDSFIAVQNGFAPMQVLQLKLDANGTRIVQQSVIDRNAAATSPTGGVVMNDQFIYVANSLWELLDAAGKFPADAVLPRPVLLSVSLRR